MTCLFRFARTAILGLLLAIAVGTPGMTQDRAEVGKVDLVQNQAYASWATERRALVVGAPILFQDVLTTGEASRLAVVLTDRTRFTMGQNASIVVDNMIFDPNSSRRVVHLLNLAGAFYVEAQKLVRSVIGMEDEVTVDTPLASIGVRGTAFWAGEIDDGFGVLAVEGVVQVTNDTQDVTLTAGEGVMLFDRTSPVSVVTWPAEKVERALATVAVQ